MTDGEYPDSRSNYQPRVVELGNPGLRQYVDPIPIITFDNVNEATGRAELVNILTKQLKNGDLFYMIAVSPTDEYKNYQNTFLAILRSVRLND